MRLPLCEACGTAVLVDGVCPRCEGPLIEVEITTDPPEPEDPPTECERCAERLIGRAIGRWSYAALAQMCPDAASLLGFEAPTDVEPSLVLAALRFRVQRLAALEVQLADARHHFETLALQLDQGDTVGARQRLAEVLHA